MACSASPTVEVRKMIFGAPWWLGVFFGNGEAWWIVRIVVCGGFAVGLRWLVDGSHGQKKASVNPRTPLIIDRLLSALVSVTREFRSFPPEPPSGAW